MLLYNLFQFQLLPIYSFVSGVVAGSAAVFYCYVVLFEKFKSKTDYLLTNMNTILGSITGLITLVIATSMLGLILLDSPNSDPGWVFALLWFVLWTGSFWTLIGRILDK